jgi:hypothetical protein
MIFTEVSVIGLVRLCSTPFGATLQIIKRPIHR